MAHRQQAQTPTYVNFLRAGAVAAGLGAAMLAGAGIASASEGSDGSSGPAKAESASPQHNSARSTGAPTRRGSTGASRPRPGVQTRSVLVRRDTVTAPLAGPNNAGRRYEPTHRIAAPSTAVASTSADPLSDFFKQLARVFFNQTPTAMPRQDPAPTAGGAITGNLHASDADDDALKFTVTTQPVHGSVIVNADGSYTYTPSATFAHTGGEDTFAVTVSDDTSFHLHLFNLFGGHTFATPVSVTLTGTNAAPRETATASVTHIDTGTGVVTGVVHVVDDDMDTLTFALGTGPGIATGSVIVDPTTGDWTFTPTEEARAVANANTLAQFAITANDGRATTSLAVVAPVTPAVRPTVTTVHVGILPTDIAVTPNGTRAYVTNTVSKTVSVIDTDRSSSTYGTEIATVTVGVDPTNVTVSPDGTHVYVINNGGRITGSTTGTTISVIDVQTNTVVTTLTVGANPTDLTFTPDGTRAYVTTNGPAFHDGAVSIIDTDLNSATYNTVIAVIPTSVEPTDVVFSTDGALAYVMNHSGGGATVLTTNTGQALSFPVYRADGTVASYTDIIGVGSQTAFSPDGGYVYEVSNPTGSAGDGVTVRNTDDGSWVTTIALRDNPYMVAGPDSSRLYVFDSGWPDDSSSVTVIDAATHTVIGQPVSLGIRQPTSVGFSADGSRVYLVAANAASEYRAVWTFDTDTFSAVGDPIRLAGNGGLDGAPADMAISPDGAFAYLVNSGQVSTAGGTVDIVALPTGL